MRQLLRYRALVLLALLASLEVSGKSDESGAPAMGRSRRLETKADNIFIKGDHPRAMRIYIRASERLTPGEHKSAMELKIARLYTLLQQPAEAIHYYGQVQAAADTLMSINDVCFYLDALRQNDQSQLAELTARHYAFRAPFDRNRRFLNTLNALSSQRYYYGKGGADYAVELIEKNTDLPEYWIGMWKGKPFYAASTSRIQDPLKIIYHQTKYYNLDGNHPLELLRTIPLELQSGPLAFSPDGKSAIAMGILYRNNERIKSIGNDQGMFVAQLYHSRIEQDGRRWSREPIFEDQQNYSYAHPVYMSDGKSIIFSSDRPGGFGGMDLYISYFDEALGKWGSPINLGASVNTEGDEIYPYERDGQLYFASNGQEGFGGYDIYRATLANDRILPGTLYHFSYPINTAYNDFGIAFDAQNGYFVSDRRGASGKDDIYTFRTTVSALGNDNVVGVSDELAAMSGNLNQIMGLRGSNTQTVSKELRITPTYLLPAEGEVMLSVYFDFNYSTLTEETVQALETLLANPALAEISQLAIVGYADDFGSDSYNDRLSRKRAETIANYLKDARVAAGMLIEGRGKITLSYDQMLEDMPQPQERLKRINPELRSASLDMLSLSERIYMNRKARRVDIIVKKQ